MKTILQSPGNCGILPWVIFMKKQAKGISALLVAVLIWGSTFVAQSVGMDYVGPFTFAAVRCTLGLLVMVPMSLFLERKNPGYWKRWTDKKLLTAGFLCGIALFFATTLQQMGLIYTDAGKSGFLTAMYIVLVPIGGLFLKRKVAKSAWLGVVLAVAGLYLLSFSGGFGNVNRGDILTIGCAVCFAIHILLVDRLAGSLNPLRLNILQALCCCLLSTVGMALRETPLVLPNIWACMPALCYSGMLSLAVGYTLQAVGQKNLNPTAASLIMSLESVVAVICGAVILRERMSGWEISGCVLMFAAVILSQLPDKKGCKA